MSTNLTPEDCPEALDIATDGLLNLLNDLDQLKHHVPDTDEVHAAVANRAHALACQVLALYQDELNRREQVGREWLIDQALTLPLDALLPPETVYRCPVCTSRFLDHPWATSVTNDHLQDGTPVSGFLCPSCAIVHGYMPPVPPGYRG